MAFAVRPVSLFLFLFGAELRLLLGILGKESLPSQMLFLESRDAEGGKGLLFFFPCLCPVCVPLYMYTAGFFGG